MDSQTLQMRLSENLAKRLKSSGLIEYSLIWKPQVTPARRQFFRLVASGHRIKDTAFSGWPSPDASVSQDGETFETWERRRIATKKRVKNGNGFTLH